MCIRDRRKVVPDLTKSIAFCLIDSFRINSTKGVPSTVTIKPTTVTRFAKSCNQIEAQLQTNPTRARKYWNDAIMELVAKKIIDPTKPLPLMPPPTPSKHGRKWKDIFLDSTLEFHAGPALLPDIEAVVTRKRKGLTDRNHPISKVQ